MSWEKGEIVTQDENICSSEHPNELLEVGWKMLCYRFFKEWGVIVAVVVWRAVVFGIVVFLRSGNYSGEVLSMAVSNGNVCPEIN